jgi:hypothetical protein
MQPGVGGRWRPDGAVHYRRDGSGQRVGMIPATCKRGLHNLAQGGYRTRVADGDGTLLKVMCTACSAAHDPDYAWSLTIAGAPPDRVEMDDEPYQDVKAFFVVRRAGTKRRAGGNNDIQATP